MPILPDKVLLFCESCNFKTTDTPNKAFHIIPWLRNLPIAANGRCKKCNGESWNLHVIYSEIESNTEQQTLGLMINAATGVKIPGTISISKSSFEAEYPHIPSKSISWALENTKERMNRLLFLINKEEQKKLEALGAKYCAHCQTMFVPQDEKNWTLSGYCSKLCYVNNEGIILEDSEEKVESPSNRLIIKIKCSQDHEFEVSKSFLGMKRPCPVCQEKVMIK